MADSKISALPASTTPLAGTEVLPIVQSSTTKQVSVANLTAGRTFDALGMTLTSTDAGASAAPLLDLYRDSASPAASDTLGEIEFNGEDSAGNKQLYGLIHGSILSPTSGAEQGQLHFETATGGASTEKMIIGTSNLVINEIGAVFNVRIEGDADANLLYTDATNDRVGVGTISPATKLDVNGTITSIGLTTTGNTILGNASSDTLNVGNGDLVKDASGNLGVGTASPSASGTGGTSRVLEVNGGSGYGILNLSTAATAIDSTTGLLQFCSELGSDDRIAIISAIKDDASSTTPKGFLYFATANAGGVAERMRIASDGVVTMSAYGAGAATFSASGVISSVSDETWKTKDGVPTNPDVMLQKLEPGYWFYNDEKKETFGKDRQLGFYAQNVHEAIGEEAAPTPETYVEKIEDKIEIIKTKPWGYYDRSVLAVAVMSLKNALNTIEELKQRIETLENR